MTGDPSRTLLTVILVAASPLACGRTTSQGAPTVAEAAPSSSVASAAVPVDGRAGTPSAQLLPAFAYREYGNPRFNFWVDVPVFFRASPPPTNGDGQEWTWGDRATMTASGMYASPPTTLHDLCDDDARAKGVTAHSLTATDCWVTGKDAGKIYWQKTRLVKGVFYSLRLDYDESLKDAFDPLVTHVNASWKASGTVPPPGP